MNFPQLDQTELRGKVILMAWFLYPDGYGTSAQQAIDKGAREPDAPPLIVHSLPAAPGERRS